MHTYNVVASKYFWIQVSLVVVKILVVCRHCSNVKRNSEQVDDWLVGYDSCKVLHDFVRLRKFVNAAQFSSLKGVEVSLVQVHSIQSLL